ncbi:molybdate ABC transporter substrate-binding protein [Bacillus shivajii]|uniref:molybdate ABC transporter substrate-binding protein n=1 Tax=Bacillus shivajii TaxID=1983719 RepID=UPI001CFC0336|nr:molybdate ABC transporter substrate-binding protein [Bacillus shivajii]UCZ54189.1 molybdate ABC transporter substrate-binding protein [Bacillus shivajii]
MYKLLIITLFTLILSGCAIYNDDNKIYVLAAASLSNVMADIKQVYEEAHPDVELVVTYGSSGRLRHQILQGAPADVFLSASTAHMDELEEKDELNKRTNLLLNQLVIALSDSNTSIKNIDDLTDFQSIAIGQPELVPAGRYAMTALMNAEIWEEIENQLVFTNDVRQALTYTETNNVDAGIVYETEAIHSSVNIRYLPVDQSLYPAIIYPIALLQESKNVQESTHFYDWLQSEDSLNIFQNHGFTTIP